MTIAHMHWTPAAFWASTPHEVYAAIEALQGTDDEQDWLEWHDETFGEAVH